VKRADLRPRSLYQVHGNVNVWEWCEDCWNRSYNGAPDDGWARTARDCERRLLRGGAWRSSPGDLRAACRIMEEDTAERNSTVGFRLARTLTP